MQRPKATMSGHTRHDLNQVNNKQKRQKNNALEEEPFLPDTSLLPQTVLEEKEKIQKLYLAISDLPEPLRQVLELKYIQGFTPAQAAKILKTSSKRVSKLLYLAKNKLKKQLEQENLIHLRQTKFDYL